MKTPRNHLLRNIIRAHSRANLLAKNPSLTLSDLQEMNSKIYNGRRQFLKDAGKIALGAGLLPNLLGGCNRSTNRNLVSRSAHEPEIAIIGGGIAGLSCLHYLSKAGIKATIYEASFRVGGRMNTRRNLFGPGINTEFGGEFIDSIHLDALALTREFGLETLDAQEEFNAASSLIKDTYFFNGRHIKEEEIIEAFIPIASSMESDINKCGKNYDTPACINFDNTSMEEYVDGLDCESWLKELLLYAYVAEYGLEAGEQSSLNLLDFIGKDTSQGFQIFGESDERFKIVGGNESLPEAMATRYEKHIKTGYKLTSIREGNNYKLSFANGREINADVVVMTLPFTVLRQVEMNITGISREKKHCIDTLGYGMNNKLILGTNGRPWRESGYAGYVYNDTIYTGWDSSHMQGGNRGPAGYTVYLSGNQALEAAKYTQAIDKFEDRIALQYLDHVDAIFPGTKAAFNQIHHAAIWTNNPYVQASYSCYRTGQWTTIAGLEGESVGNIYFAGEHCSEEFQGFMNGAIETGKKVAETIISR